MRRLLYVLPIVTLMASCSVGADDAMVTNAAGVASAKEDQPVQLRARIVSRQSRNHYVVADESGNAIVKITKKQRQGAPLLPGMTVEIQGEVDARPNRPPRVEATSVTVLAATGQPQPEPARP